MQLKKITKSSFILSAIVLVGIFLRAYNFHDLLRFNADQSRDVAQVQAMLNGQSSLLVMGPKAGGTDFRLGPAFYYFQYLSGKIFGGAPDKLAYPDLSFSILAIILLYFLLRYYFSRNTSLAVTFLFAVSSYAVWYSRFAWNINSTPFWTMLFLYSFLMLADKNRRYKFWWAVLVGIAVGVGVQLHTLLLLSLPVITLIFFGYLYWRQKNISWWKFLAVVILVSLALNIPQFAIEMGNGGKDVQAFFGGIKTKSGRNKSLVENLLADVSCNIQTNTFSISSLGTDDQCGMGEWKASGTGQIFSPHKTISSLIETIGIIAGIIFSVGGYVLFGCFWKNEKDERKKTFLALLGIYLIFLFLIFFTVANEISLRYYLLLAFAPFLLAAFWLKFITERFQKYGVVILGVILVILTALNLATVQYDLTLTHSNFNNVTLSEVEFLTNFVESNTQGASQAYIGGNKLLLFKCFKSMQVLSQNNNLKLIESSSSNLCSGQTPFFFIDNYNAEGRAPKGLAGQAKVENYSSYAHFTIYKLSCQI